MTLHGTVAAVVTPLRDGGTRLDEGAVDGLAAFVAAGGCDGVLVAGTTGEGLLLTTDERRALAEAWLDAVPDGIEVAVHAGAQTTAEAVALAEHAARAGAAAVAVIGPPYFAFDDGRARGALRRRHRGVRADAGLPLRVPRPDGVRRRARGRRAAPRRAPLPQRDEGLRPLLRGGRAVPGAGPRRLRRLRAAHPARPGGRRDRRGQRPRDGAPRARRRRRRRPHAGGRRGARRGTQGTAPSRPTCRASSASCSAAASRSPATSGRRCAASRRTRSARSTGPWTRSCEGCRRRPDRPDGRGGRHRPLEAGPHSISPV